MKPMIDDCKPFLKWAGGKTQLLKDIERSLPADINNWKNFTYVEPFVGSGAVLFWVLRNFPNLKRAIINDINPDLIKAYTAIQKKPKQLITGLKDIQTQYYALPNEDKRAEFFYEQRSLYNEKPKDIVLNTVLFIFLNRTCFNGLYRVNSKGGFNVPFGKYTNPTICDEQTILADNLALQKVELFQGDFSQTKDYAHGRETLFYFDPPYKPVSASSSFTAYAKDGFNDDEQERLKRLCDLLNKNECYFLLSNSDVNTVETNNKYFDNLYSDYYIDRVFAKRSISANAAKRETLKELLISNYAPQKDASSIRA